VTKALIMQIPMVSITMPRRVILDPNRAINLGTKRSPIIAAIDPPVYRKPSEDSEINWFKNDELLYRMSAVCTENKNPIT
jgi:hypothetical protein